MSNIDWDFIGELEGKRILNGYVPTTKNMKSGVTIATGFDLGQRNEGDLSGLPKALIEKLKPYLGIKGAEAKTLAGNLKITDSEAKTIDEFSHGEVLNDLRKKWKAKTGKSFDDLPMHKATIVASVRFQHGDLATKTPNFWRQTTTGDWQGATENLRNFQDEHPRRRNKEADYLTKGRINEDLSSEIESTLAKTAPPDAPSRQMTDEQLIKSAQMPDIITEPSKKKLGELDAVPQIIEERVSPTTAEMDAVPEIRQTITEPVVLPDLADDLPIIEKPQLDVPTVGPNEKPKSYYQLPKQADIESSYTSLYGEPNTVYGDRIPSQLRNQDQYDYDVFDRDVDVLGAAFRQYNIFSALGRAIESSYADFQPEEGYSAYNDKELAKKIGGSDMLYMFRHNNSHAESMLQLEHMQEDYEDMKILNAHESTAAELAAGLASPVTLLPLAPMRVLKMASPVKRFVGGTAFTAAAVMPEQMIIESQNEYRDASHSALMLSALSLVGGALTAKFGKNIAATTPPRSGGDDGIYRAAGAGVSPERYRQSMYATMEQEALEETGVGLEKVGWNPVLRMAKSSNPFVRSLAPMMVNMGGLMQKKVRASGEKMADSVEAKFTGMYMGPLLDSIRDANLAYLKYRGVAANKTKTDIGTSIELVKLAARDKLGQTVDYLSETQFRIRVGRAMRNGDVDTIADEATEAVNAAAQSYRKTFNLIKEQAESVRLFEAQLVDDLGKARAAGDTVAVSRIEEALRKLQEQGVTPNNAKSYLPRIYRVDMIMKHQREFLSIIADHARRELGLRGAKAEAYAQEVMDTVTRNRPFYDADEVIDSLDFVKNASGVQARTLDIDDMRIEKFLENDAEVLLRHHVKTMGMDIELTRAFGSVTMKGTIDEVVTEYKRLMDETADPQARATLSKQMEADLRDIRGLRDRLRGTYGASKDPHAMSSRFIRTMKSFNVFTSMGSAMISSVPDVARTVMVEGLTNTYEKGFRHLFNKQAEYVKAMKRRELRMAGVAADAVLGLRAHAFSDVGDLFGSRYGFERGLNKATGMFFMMNGLNYWNQALKEFAGNVTMLRMTDSLMRNWDSLKAADREKFLKNGIDRQDHYRMAQQIRQHGKRVNGEWMPNTDSWTDSTLRLRFRMALNQNVERIIITPGAGDRALWTSTEMGSFLTQFKSYGQGAMIRMLTSGLQEKDGAFWQGAFLLVGLAALVNEIKKAQYGIEGEESFDEKLINAVDRSGILGWSMDVNNALEKMSDYKLGMRPFLTDQPSFALPETAKAGAVFGPGISNIMNATKVMGDVVTFNADQSTADTARFLTPTGNIPYLDPLWDGLYGQ